MALRDALSAFRSLCGEKGLEAVRMPGGVYRLVRLDIGHAVQNTARQRLGFSLQEAIDYLRAIDPDEV
jgi:hypothetical protein